MKFILTFMLCIGYFGIHNSFGQEETKKVIVVKKVIDENGKETIKKEEASGKDAEALLKKMKEEGKLEGIDIDLEIEKAKKTGSAKKSIVEDVTVEKSIENGKEISTYKITTEEGGEKKVMVWKGDGDMPEEMSKILKDVDVKINKNGNEQEMTITIDTDDNDTDMEIHETHTIEKRIVVKHKNDNKVSLGVMISDDSKGVVVTDIVDDSAAQKAGLKSGDTILKVDETYVFNTQMLLDALSAIDTGSTAKITYLREGKEKSADVKF
ncbi:MAG: PDZ domain-containing protein [Saprospiraceae bacterium]|nr:PDZ domain-containing protein [Saprospiraceae bacterium]